MTTTELQEATIVDYLPGFDEEQFLKVTEQGEPALLIAKREEAFNDYRTIVAPTVTTEEWRRTDPTLFPLGELKRLPNLQRVKELPPSPWDDHFDAVVAVNADEFAITDRTGALKKRGITVLSLADAAEQKPDLVKEYLQGKALPAKSGKYEAFNDAFWNFGIFIHVPDRIELEKGILVRYHIDAPDGLFIPRTVAVVGNHSRAVIAEHLESPDTIRFMAVPERELYVGEGANLKMVSLQEWGLKSYQIANDWGLVQRDANLNWFTLNFGTKLSKMKFGSDVAGPGSAADMDGIFFAAGKQHMDQRTLQIHSSANTYSRLLYKGAVKDKAHSIYQGLIIARPGAIKVDAYQTNNNLVLNEGARADSIPGLLIDADDLKCSHGSTLGNLDPEQMFYLRSHGIGENEARRLLIMGFFEEVVERIPYEFIRDIVHENIREKMGA